MRRGLAIFGNSAELDCRGVCAKWRQKARPDPAGFSGRSAPKKRLAKQEGDSRLRRRLLAIEKLGTAEKRQVLQLIDAFIERGQLRTKVQGRSAQ